MNEITRIHIAKVAYDIEVGAKKELEKYIKSLESYSQDDEVLADIEIRMTELLAERKVAAGSVIGSDDIDAIRKQLGEPYEFAAEDGDIAVGEAGTHQNRRLYRNNETALLGGVLSGVAAYFNVNPLWPRLLFVLLLVISFGFAALLYVLFWAIIPAAKTVAEKLQLAGKPVTLESIRELNELNEGAQTRSSAPLLQTVLRVGLGIVSSIAAIATLTVTAWGASVIFHSGNINTTFGIGNPYEQMNWVVFWILVAGALLLTMLFSLVAYAFLAKRFTKQMLVSAVIIVCIGVMAGIAAFAIMTTQSWRLSNEARSQMQTTRVGLPKEFETVRSIVFERPAGGIAGSSMLQEDSIASTYIQYVVDEGAPRYELSALPKVKLVVEVKDSVAHVALNVPDDYLNSFTQPTLMIYGPALDSIDTNGVRMSYSSTESQDTLKLDLTRNSSDLTVSGTFQSVVIEGKGWVDVTSSTIQSLDVRSENELSVQAGTVRNLIVSQPDSCPSTVYSLSASVALSGVTSGQMTYNGKQMPAKTYQSSCASVTVGDSEQQ